MREVLQNAHKIFNGNALWRIHGAPAASEMHCGRLRHRYRTTMICWIRAAPVWYLFIANRSLDYPGI